MKKTLGTMAAAAILMASTAAAPALAQTTAPSATPAAPGAQTDTTMPPAGNGAATPSTGSSATGTTGTTGSMGAANTGAGAQDYLTQQTETQISANDYIGQSIYNGEDKSIGNVNDLILEENGGIVAAVVGVGGFLGIGAKNVAVPMSKINVSRDPENNNVRLTTMETAESLKAAPEFRTLDDQQTDNTTTSSTGGAATTTAPAGGATTPSTTSQP
ncbi:PRC-barrel domain-containing protein [Rhizobium sp. CSW-27]|uniref:PRC-barrel domain-containing protein n=1 Tax=Rhizobium sp. CSW-27 TaxID=2839985 RepID=UPI001C033999|nr:PRC-barrel domain-containing protein [Rhizobium sp. CSW-27]MBT9368904.1 PRC-barrel domain-containing protein [Rhizobium sp. CSW-27]